MCAVAEGRQRLTPHADSNSPTCTERELTHARLRRRRDHPRRGAHYRIRHTNATLTPSFLAQAAYCDPGLISEVVVCVFCFHATTCFYVTCVCALRPLLSMQQSVLLCISTILDSGNHYTKMMELTDGAFAAAATVRA